MLSMVSTFFLFLIPWNPLSKLLRCTAVSPWKDIRHGRRPIPVNAIQCKPLPWRRTYANRSQAWQLIGAAPALKTSAANSPLALGPGATMGKKREKEKTKTQFVIPARQNDSRLASKSKDSSTSRAKAGQQSQWSTVGFGLELWPLV